MQPQNTGSYYLTIPGPVFDDSRLSLNAKCLYGLIQSLSNKRGYCWATNQHFAERFGADQRSIQRWLTELKDCLLIEIETSETGVREIYSNESQFLRQRTEMSNGVTDLSGGVTSVSGGGDKFVRGGTTSVSPLSDKKQRFNGSTEPQKEDEVVPSIKVNNKYNRPSAENEISQGPKPITFEDFMEERGCRRESLVDSENHISEWWEDDNGKKLKSAEVRSLKSEWQKSQGFEKKVDNSTLEAENLATALIGVLEREYGTAPVIGRETKAMLRQNLIQKYDKDFIKRYAQWYFIDSDLDKKWRFNIPAFTSERFINSFLAQQ